MCLIFTHIVSDILIDIVGYWIAPPDLYVFDSSLCNKQSRDSYYDILISSKFSFNPVIESKIGHSWVIKRNIMLRSLNLNSIKELEWCTRINVCSVQQIHLASFGIHDNQKNVDILLYLFQRSVSLESLLVCDTPVFTDSFILKMDPRMLSRLKKLDVIQFESQIELPAYMHLVKHLSNVRELSLLTKSNVLVDARVIDVVSRLSHVVKASLLISQQLTIQKQLQFEFDRHLEHRSDLISKIAVKKGSIESFIYYTSYGKKCSVGIESRPFEGRPPYVECNRGCYSYEIDSKGHKRVIWIDSKKIYEESIDNLFGDYSIQQRQLIFGNFSEFASIILYSSQICSTLEIINSKNTDNLQTLCLGCPDDCTLESSAVSDCVKNISTLIQSSRFLKRVELLGFPYLSVSDYVAIFKPLSTVRQVHLNLETNSKGGNWDITYLFDILDAAEHIEYIEAHLGGGCGKSRMEVLQKYCKNRYFARNRDHEDANGRDCGRYEIFRVGSNSFEQFAMFDEKEVAYFDGWYVEHEI